MLQTLTEIASALSDPSRLRLLAAVIDPPSQSGEVCVCDLTDLVDLAPSTVSKHLSILRDAGLIEGRKDGRWMHYRAARDPETRALRDALEWVRLAKATDKHLLADAARIRTIICAGAPGRCCSTDGSGPSAPKQRIIFLCTGNSCRSQMAEGWARHLRSADIDARSAGTRPHGLNPLAVRVMREAGVDISSHQSRHIDDFAGESFDLAITVCDSARQACPLFPGAARTIHRSFDDPPRLAESAKTEDEALAHYRRVRDEIRAFVEELPRAAALAASNTRGGAA